MISENSNKSKKVCHVTSAHPRYDVRIFHKECKSLANNGYKVTLLVNDNSPDEFIDGVKIVSTKLIPKNRFDRMIRSKKNIKKKMIEIDAEIYHFHDPELIPVAVWIKNKGKKVIFDFHEDVPQQILFKKWIPKSARGLVSRSYKWYESRNARKFDALISVTPKFVERLKNINSNTIMITNFPIITSSTVKTEIHERRVICFAGGISSQWNHENIIRAIESIDNIEYILAGVGPIEYIEKLKKLDGWKKVRYLGKVPHSKVLEIYKESMIGMTLLSHNTQVGDEGTLGNTKIYEFMESGLPVICSNNRLWRNMVEEHKCGICVDPNNVYDIINAIKWILSNVNSSSIMGENGRKAILSNFNWKTQEALLIDCYRKI